MSSSYDLSVYFSHPWRSHLALNLAIWERLSGGCHLLLDRPIQTIFQMQPPYFINRVESLLGRSDLFVACLPLGADPSPEEVELGGDWRLRCSPYVLFEVRMAERADLPRFVAYDPRTGFRPPPNPGPHARYVPARLDELSQRLETGGTSILLATLEEWLGWVKKMISPGVERDLFRAAYLISDDAKLKRRVLKGTHDAGFYEPVDLAKSYTNDAELNQLLRTLRLLIVDVSDRKLLPLYQMAHALMIPCIRMHRRPMNRFDRHLPQLLRGHRAGYQHDLLAINADDIVEGVAARAQAVVDDANPITTFETGRYELQQRGFKQHCVFISHNLKGEDRQLVSAIITQFRSRGIDFWEYEDQNQAGQDWRANLDTALNRMTHFIALETYNYDQSVMCVHEMKVAREREAKKMSAIRAFRVADRASPAVELRDETRTHQPLPRAPEAAALLIAGNILNDIRR